MASRQNSSRCLRQYDGKSVTIESENDDGDLSSGSSDVYVPSNGLNSSNSDASSDKIQETKRNRKKGDPTKWKKNIRKRNRAAGKEYVNVKGKVVPAKVFIDYSCNCKLKCSEKISVVDRKKFFDLFYTAESWETQTTIITGAIKCHTPKRRTTRKDNTQKQVSRAFFIPTTKGDVKVCKELFMQTLQINSARVHRALQKVKGSVNDLRGKYEPHNKNSAVIDIIRDHIKSFPTTISHYTRRDSTKKYLSTSLNLSLMYRLFVHYMKENSISQNVPSQSLYEKVFRRDFNLSFKPPRKDTCNKCDSLNVQIKSAESLNEVNEVQQLKDTQQLHHRKAQLATDTMQDDLKISKNADDPSVISIDMQSVMLLPKLTTGVVYYKRQVSCYNLGIHDFKTSKAAMHVWDESVASRVAQEVGSCIIKYLKCHELKVSLIIWSDSCGGQNRNIKIACLWMHIVQSPEFPVTEVVHKFLEPGHSFLPNDRDFADIEKKMKYFPEVLSPNQWCSIIENCRPKKNKFDVVHMKSEDFKNTSVIQLDITHRKKTEEGDKVEWLKIKQMKFSADKLGVMEFKYNHNDLVNFLSVNFNKRKKGRPVNLGTVVLPALYPERRKLSEEKVKDVKSLLHFIPPVHHDFYNNLLSSDSVNDDEISVDEDYDDDDE